ncbi:hypothetical protein D3C86_1723780 [compost metagenome]
MAARVGFSPEIIIKNLSILASGAQKNFLITDGHHASEKTALVETVNSMMLQTLDNTLYIFPNWVKSSASFTRLRTKGAFLVSADYDGTTITNMSIYSEKGTKCQIHNPWKEKEIQVMENGKQIAVSKTGERFSFETKIGRHYIIKTIGA